MYSSNFVILQVGAGLWGRVKGMLGKKDVYDHVVCKKLPFLLFLPLFALSPSFSLPSASPSFHLQGFATELHLQPWSDRFWRNLNGQVNLGCQQLDCSVSNINKYNQKIIEIY